MDGELPDEFELVVIGTGMIESIVAAAASRIGKTVLHIDSNDFYGGSWASFNLEGIDKYIINPQLSSNVILQNISEKLKEDETFLDIGNNLFGISNVSHEWHIPKKTVTVTATQKPEIDANSEENKPKVETNETDENKIESVEEDADWTQEKFLKNSRKFNLDLAPKLQFARGDFVELLISSNIARYSEYRSVSRVLTWQKDQLEVVPCSRSDVFSNTRVSVVEKRMLMKLLSTCMDGDESQFHDYQGKTFQTYLKDKKMTPNLIHYVLYAISMSTDKTPCLEGVERTKRFLSSLGRFGKTPFLFSMYGSGELPQAFCRLCAVFGGTYCLNRPVKSLIIDLNGKCSSVMCANQRINAAHFVISIEKIPEKYTSSWATEMISRAIFITDKSILPSEKENLTLLLFPPENEKNSVTILELGTATGTCPQDLYVIHMYCKQVSTDPKKDFEHCVNRLLTLDGSSSSETQLPRVLWSLYYTVQNTYDCDAATGLPENMYPCSGPDLDLDYDESVKKAKDIFMKMYPDCEFLPRAPDPEEIILCDDDESKETLPTDDVFVDEAETSSSENQINNQCEQLVKEINDQKNEENVITSQ